MIDRDGQKRPIEQPEEWDEDEDDLADTETMDEDE